MTYNLHPLFVHFPIALLFLYSIIKILPWKKWFPLVGWRDIERVLLLVGVLGSFAALITGNMTRELVNPNVSVVEMHELFAVITAIVYGALLLGEIAMLCNTRFPAKTESLDIKPITIFLERLLTDPVFSKLLAAVGFITLFVTGLLGGVMSYGTSADPLAPLVLKLLGIDF